MDTVMPRFTDDDIVTTHADEAMDPVRRYLDTKASAAYQAYAGSFPVDDPPTTVQGALIFFDQCVELMLKKDAAYQGAWRTQGYMGNISRVLSKVARLRSQLWGDTATAEIAHDGTVVGEGEESLRDTLMDLANLCYFATRNIEEGNRWGS